MSASRHLTRNERLHAATEMALYIAIILLATLSALPDNYDATGVDGPPLLLVLWGTVTGLTLAHWFAFNLASAQLHGGLPPRRDVERLGMQALGAVTTMLLTTIPVVLVGPSIRVEAAGFAPAAMVGLAGYGVARTASQPRLRAAMTGVLVLALGLVVATLKATLTGH